MGHRVHGGQAYGVPDADWALRTGELKLAYAETGGTAMLAEHGALQLGRS